MTQLLRVVCSPGFPFSLSLSIYSLLTSPLTVEIHWIFSVPLYLHVILGRLS